MGKGSISKVKLRLVGVSTLLREMQPQVDEAGERVAGEADGNYRYVSTPHRYTSRGHVETADQATAKKDAETAELLRALGRSVR